MNTGFVFFATCGLLFGISACQPEEPTPPQIDCGAEVQRLGTIDYSPQPYTYPQPIGFPPMSFPADNPPTQQGVALGQRLFFDKRLSGNNLMSCASCHQPQLSYTDGLAKAVGIDGIMGRRSSMSLLNIGFSSNNNVQGFNFMWDGRFSTLEEQAIQPVLDPLELHATWEDVECKLRNDTLYPRLFREAFGIESSTEITRSLAVKAISQYQRALISAESKYDRAILRQEPGEFLEEDELNGYIVYFQDALGGSILDPSLPDAQCGHCHGGPLMSSNLFVNNGLQDAPTLNDFADNGLGEITNNPNNNGFFRAPTLRNIALTAPYMHDGRFQTLEEVIDHYDVGGHYSPNRSPFLIQLEQQPEMSPVRKAELLAFLHTLTDTSYLQNPLFLDPWE